ncbi:MAG TPA: Mini-ribonuclease 3 [Cyanobacteria bacterium UBA12227]|nr:Mini-ribonuclease 3 [Cyanobacteria bacterium UBA12227]HAX88385.1 Mini-ribonuclease 3 [Cyanobacteria bacterium UBA11370]HBY78448.1 Mini-ribonuclease 3 [Cyanobacteria bacterium UBA11148]
MTLEEEEVSSPLDPNSALSWAELRFRQLSTTANSLSRIQEVSPASLAYLGDAVYELYIRTCYLLPPRRVCDYHNQVVGQVRAESQAKILRSLEPHLTDPELELLRRGRNATTGTVRRLNPKIYQQATSLETLLGYLYLTDPQRLIQLLAHLELDPP